MAWAAISMSVLLDRSFEATFHELVIPAVCTEDLEYYIVNGLDSKAALCASVANFPLLN